MIGAPAALHISPIPWNGPLASARVGRIDGKLIANPTYQELDLSDMDIVVSASRDAIIMVEGECKEISEEDFIEAVFFGHQAVQGVIEVIEKLRQAVGQPKWASGTAPQPSESLQARVRDASLAAIKAACNAPEKAARAAAFSQALNLAVTALRDVPPEEAMFIKPIFEKLQYQTMREQVLDAGT